MRKDIKYARRLYGVRRSEITVVYDDNLFIYTSNTYSVKRLVSLIGIATTVLKVVWIICYRTVVVCSLHLLNCVNVK